MATNIDIQGTPISRLPREMNPDNVDVAGVKSGRTVKVSLNTLATKEDINKTITNNKGYFSTDTELIQTYPEPKTGWYAYVGLTGTIWKEEEGGGWINSGDPIPGDAVEIEGQLSKKVNISYEDGHASIAGGGPAYKDKWARILTVPGNECYTISLLYMLQIGINDIPRQNDELIITNDVNYKLRNVTSKNTNGFFRAKTRLSGSPVVDIYAKLTYYPYVFSFQVLSGKRESAVYYQGDIPVSISDLQNSIEIKQFWNQSEEIDPTLALSINISQQNVTDGYVNINNLVDYSNVIISNGTGLPIPENLHFNAVRKGNDYYDTQKIYRFSFLDEITSFTVYKGNSDEVLFSYPVPIPSNQILHAVPPQDLIGEWSLFLSESTSEKLENKVDITSLDRAVAAAVGSALDMYARILTVPANGLYVFSMLYEEYTGIFEDEISISGKVDYSSVGATSKNSSNMFRISKRNTANYPVADIYCRCGYYTRTFFPRLISAKGNKNFTFYMSETPVSLSEIENSTQKITAGYVHVRLNDGPAEVKNNVLINEQIGVFRRSVPDYTDSQKYNWINESPGILQRLIKEGNLTYPFVEINPGNFKLNKAKQDNSGYYSFANINEGYFNVSDLGDNGLPYQMIQCARGHLNLWHNGKPCFYVNPANLALLLADGETALFHLSGLGMTLNNSSGKQVFRKSDNVTMLNIPDLALSPSSEDIAGSTYIHRKENGFYLKCKTAENGLKEIFIPFANKNFTQSESQIQIDFSYSKQYDKCVSTSTSDLNLILNINQNSLPTSDMEFLLVYKNTREQGVSSIAIPSGSFVKDGITYTFVNMVFQNDLEIPAGKSAELHFVFLKVDDTNYEIRVAGFVEY